MKKIIVYFLLASFYYHCSYNSENDLIEDIVIEDSISYEANIKVIIDNNCTGCHSSPPANGAPMALVTYDDVKDAVENRNLIGRISTDDLGFLMPFGGPKLPQNLIDLIILWEEEGLLEN